MLKKANRTTALLLLTFIAVPFLLSACSTARKTLSPRRIVDVDISGDAARISGISVPGNVYRLQKTDDLVGGTWQDVGKPVTASSDRVSFIDPILSDKASFFRIIVTE